MDIQHDSNLTNLYHMLSENPQAKELVKSASIPEGEEWAELPDSAFADSINREFPILDKENAAISLLYAHKYGATEMILDAIKVATSMYEIDDEVLLKGFDKEASVEEPIAFLLEEAQKYPVYSKATVVKAAEYLVEYHQDMTTKDRSEYCANLVKLANELGVELERPVLKVAGYTMTGTVDLGTMLFSRAARTYNQEAKDAYIKVADFLCGGPNEISTRAAQTKLADIISKIDGIAGVDTFSTKCPSPLDLVYNTTKLAEMAFSMGPYTITQTKLAEIDSDLLGDIIGDDIVTAMVDNVGDLDYKEAAEVLPTLPRDIQDVVARTFRL